MAAKAELEQIMMVPRNIVRPSRTNRSWASCRIPLASARMTVEIRSSSRISVQFTHVGRRRLGRRHPASGDSQAEAVVDRETSVLPDYPKLNFKGKGNRFPKKGADTLNWSDGTVLIHQGKLLTGVMDKKILGTSGGSSDPRHVAREGFRGDDVPDQPRANADEQLARHRVV